MLSNSGRQIILLHRMNDRKMEAAARRICEAVREKTGLLMSAGIDGGAQDVHVAYSQANKAWRSARTSQRDILTYDQVTLELFTEDVSDTVKQEYVGKFFRKCSHEELCQWMGLLEEYFGQEGSLLHTAQALHIHKNTLTYKPVSYTHLIYTICSYKLEYRAVEDKFKDYLEADGKNLA